MDFNIWSVIVATVVAFVISSIWYSPILFGKEWMEMSGISSSDAEGMSKTKMIWLYVVQLVVTFITFVVIGFAMSFASADRASDGAIIGIIAWLGFIMPIHVGSLIWERKPIKLVLINTISVLLNLVVGGAIIGAW